MKHLKIYLILLFVFLSGLSGCASVDKNFTKFEGRNVQAVVSRLGYPQEKMEMMGKTIYKWKHGNPMGYYCALDAIVDKNDTIVDFGYTGNNGGCHDLALRLQ